MSKSTAALTGVLFASMMTAWQIWSNGVSADEAMIRFAIYFPFFSIGFYLLSNFLLNRGGK
jgi:hypothetical protein